MDWNAVKKGYEEHGNLSRLIREFPEITRPVVKAQAKAGGWIRGNINWKLVRRDYEEHGNVSLIAKKYTCTRAAIQYHARRGGWIRAGELPEKTIQEPSAPSGEQLKEILSTISHADLYKTCPLYAGSIDSNKKWVAGYERLKAKYNELLKR